MRSGANATGSERTANVREVDPFAMRWRVVPLDNCRGDRERWPMRALIDSIFAAPAGSQPRQKTGYSDIVLAFAAVLIITLMILPLPMAVIDTLVAFNIAIGFGLLLMAIYIPSPVAFSSFPSVLLLTTLFRLALSIAITKSILLEAEAGHIIDTFGTMVAGGNLVVGLVVFLIITVVQFWKPRASCTAASTGR